MTDPKIIVTQEDIDRAEEWRRSWRHCPDERTALYEAFARHRIASTSNPQVGGEVGELVAWLRKGVIEVGLHEDNNTELFDIEEANGAMFEAADTILALQSECDALRHDIERQVTITTEQANENARLQSRVDVLTEALLLTQALLETTVRLHSTNFADVHDRVIANRAALSDDQSKYGKGSAGPDGGEG